MKLSISLRNSLNGWEHDEMKNVDGENFEAIAALICQNVWSPISYRNDYLFNLVETAGKKTREYYRHIDSKNPFYRIEMNFDSCQLLALDFDDGAWTIEQAKYFCNVNRYAHIIAPTKSHRKEKGKNPACDRFRVIIPFSAKIASLEHYRQQMESILTMIPCDSKCKDGARFFYPCTEIFSISVIGCGYPVESLRKKPEQKKRAKSKAYATHGVLPVYIRRWIENPANEGDRNNTCFRIACEMAKYGFPETDIIQAVLSSNNDLPETEKLTAIRSGIRRGSSNRR